MHTECSQCSFYVSGEHVTSHYDPADREPDGVRGQFECDVQCSGHGHSVELKPSDLANGRLSQTSWVRADKIYTVNGQAVQQRIAMAKPELLARVRKQLCPAVGCK